jgi:hypothetical protein
VIALSVVAVAYGATRTTATKRAAGNGACGALMSNPKALKAMQALRTEHRADMKAWYDQYGSDPQGAEAQAALQQLRDEHWNDMQQLFKKFGIKAPTTQPGQSGGMMGGAGGCGGACGGSGASGGMAGWAGSCGAISYAVQYSAEQTKSSVKPAGVTLPW